LETDIALQIRSALPRYGIRAIKKILSVETMYVGLVVITLLGFLFSVILNELERIIVPWKALR
jgi:ABC-type nitrate/sulfonate/bicarbonate transport system permease component